MEYRKKCNVCGNVFCYTDEDVRKNNTSALMSTISGIGAVAGALSGNWGAARANQESAYHEDNRIIDFNHCPKCKSTNLSLMSESEWENYKKEIEFAKSGGVTINANASEESLIKRIKMFIEDEDWPQARAYCDQVLDINPENGEVYYLRLLVDYRLKSADEVIKSEVNLNSNKYFLKAKRYGNTETIKTLQYIQDGINRINENRQRLEEERKQQEEERKQQNIDKAVNDAIDMTLSKDLSKVNYGIGQLNSLKDTTSVDYSDALKRAYEHKEALEEKQIQKRKRIALISIPLFILIIVAVALINMSNTKKYSELAAQTKERIIGTSISTHGDRGKDWIYDFTFSFHRDDVIVQSICDFYSTKTDRREKRTESTVWNYTIRPKDENRGVITMHYKAPSGNEYQETFTYYFDTEMHMTGRFSFYSVSF